MMEDHENIKATVLARGISRLCHFTPSRKFAHILTEFRGIYSTAYLKANYPDILDQTDSLRLDGYEDYISCSIEYPNTWYLTKAKQKDRLFLDWIVLLLSPDLLWETEVLFCPRNAAAGRGSYVVPGYEGFTRLFLQSQVGASGMVFNRTQAMLSCCPTDDQAEALILRHIPLKYLVGVAVSSEEQMLDERYRLNQLNYTHPVNWVVCSELFSGTWSSMVRNGMRPIETWYRE